VIFESGLLDVHHGFATLGQIVEDVSDRPFDEYLRDPGLRALGGNIHVPTALPA
jgi:hypothetical protein